MKIFQLLLLPLAAYHCKEEEVTVLSERIDILLPQHLHKNFVMCGNYVYCWNHKAASTTILQQLAKWCEVQKLFDGSNVTRMIEFAAPKDNQELLEGMETKFVFSVVRHPFTRLISAFRDRLLNHPESWQAQKYVPKIMKNQENSTLTFDKFVRFLLKTPVDDFDDHWIPQNFHCKFNVLNYDAILKVERLEKDFQSYFGYNLEHTKSLSNSYYDDYFSLLTEKEIQHLRKIYESDFKLLKYPK